MLSSWLPQVTCLSTRPGHAVHFVPGGHSSSSRNLDINTHPCDCQSAELAPHIHNRGACSTGEKARVPLLSITQVPRSRRVGNACPPGSELRVMTAKSAPCRLRRMRSAPAHSESFPAGGSSRQLSRATQRKVLQGFRPYQRAAAGISSCRSCMTSMLRTRMAKSPINVHQHCSSERGRSLQSAV